MVGGRKSHVSAIQIHHRDMEAEDGYERSNIETGAGYKPIREETNNGFEDELGVKVSQAPTSIRMVEWLGDWDLFKRMLRSAALCSGTDSAVRLAEKLAKGRQLKDLKAAEPNLVALGAAQSRRLHAQLTLSLVKTVGPQQALLESGFEDDEDGVAVMVRLVKHFEHTTKELRAHELHSKWAREILQPDEHPSLLYTRLLSIQRQLATLGEDLTQSNMVKKLVTAIQEGDGGIYDTVIDGYERGVVMGQPQTTEQLLELMAIKHRKLHKNPKTSETMVGLAAVNRCNHCCKMGHTEEKYWNKNPELKRKDLRGKRAPKSRNKSMNQIKCFECGKRGHVQRNCQRLHNEESEGIVATIKENNNNIINCYIPYFVDSGCTCHLVASLSALENPHPKPATMIAIGGHLVRVTHQERTRITTAHGTLILNEAYYAKGLGYNLISVPTLNAQNVKVIFNKHEAYLEKGPAKIHLVKLNGLWALPVEHNPTIAALRMERGNLTSGETWHCRLGHPGKKQTEELLKQGSVPEEALRYDTRNCNTCSVTKPTRRPVPHVAERSGESTVQVDYMPMGSSERGWKGEVGAYVFSDRNTKITKAYPVKSATSTEAVASLDLYLTQVAPYMKNKVTCIQSDAGNQFVTNEWSKRCADEGITYRHCPIDHQAMNGQVERVQGILAAKVRALLQDGKLQTRYWPLALETATYLINRTPHTSLGGISPLEMATGRKVDLRHTRKYGCTAFVQVPKAQRKGKLGETAWRGTLVGYVTTSPEWPVLDPRTSKIRGAYSVKFNEHETGVQNQLETVVRPLVAHNIGSQWTQTPNDCGPMEREVGTPEEDLNTLTGEPGKAPGPFESWDSTLEECTPEVRQQEVETRNADPEPPDNSSMDSPSVYESDDSSWQENGDHRANHQMGGSPRRSTRDRQQFDPNHMPSGTREMENLRKQIDQDSSDNDEEGSGSVTEDAEGLTDLGLSMALHMDDRSVPRSWRQALSMSHWGDAMQCEISQLKQLDAWELVPRPPGVKILPGLWRFKVKKDENGKVARYKARWCVNGSRCDHTWTPEQIYSPVAELCTVRLLFATAATTGQPVLQADVPNAYLNAEVGEKMYVVQPHGLEEPGQESRVCLLKKALYGSQISGRKWHE